MRDYLSWGRVHRYEHEIRRMFWLSDDFSFLNVSDKKVLAHALGRSYGDVCLNANGILIDTIGLNRFKSFDADKGIISCEAGVSLANILELALPHGWFLPVTPGTKFVSIGGAIANDVHGKNHHIAGTFGDHVLRFELLRSDGKRYLCSPTENKNLYHATIGGLGLTGFITWAEIKLIPVKSLTIDMESIKFYNLDEFFELSRNSDSSFNYTVAWIDCFAKGKNLGRGLFMRGNHSPGTSVTKNHKMPIVKVPRFSIPITPPNFLLNKFVMRLFNNLYFQKQQKKNLSATIHYDPFFYPLDAVGQWNKLYGKRGFFQYQFVLPAKNQESVSELLKIITDSGLGSPLAVLKTFGKKPSCGMMSFAKEGVTLALDFPNNGLETTELLRLLDKKVLEFGGRVNPSKDGVTEASYLQEFYPQWKDFKQYIDPKFSSSFWRRLTGEKMGDTL